MTIPLLDPAKVDAVVFHHTETPATASIDSIRSYHLSRGWEDIGYHFLIQDGKVIEGRPIIYKGSHAHSEKVGRGFNGRSLGIAIVDTLTWRDPDSVTLEACESLIWDLSKRYPGILQQIIDHGEAMAIVGDWKHTNCPGRHWVGALRWALTRAWSDFRM